MDWNTIPIEIIERILVFTRSPRTVLSASSVSKNWQAIGDDQPLWKEVFYATSSTKYIGDHNGVDWKKKVLDVVLIRKNIKQGRCIVKTLSTPEALTNRITLHPDNSSLHKDFHLVNWRTTEDLGSYGNVTRLKSHLIDMVREEYIEIDDKEIAFIGKFIAKSPSSLYGGMSYKDTRVQSFDEEKSRQGQVFDPSKAIELSVPNIVDSRPIMNYCEDSKYIGFCFAWTRGPKAAYVFDGTTGKMANIQSIPAKDASSCYLGLYDNYLAIRPENPKKTNEHLCVLTDGQTKITKRFQEPYEMCLMRKDEVVFRCNKRFIIWNYQKDTEKDYPVGQVGSLPVKMIYHNMWIAIEGYNAGIPASPVLSFYDIRDGKKVGSVSFKSRTPMDNGFSQLSDGRLAVCLTSGCHVISFMNSEVTRMIKVLLMDIEGNVKEHEIMACQLATFYVDFVKGVLPEMTSRVVPYQSHSENERYVMIFSSSTGTPNNSTATALLKDAVKPTQVNTPYQGWACDNTVQHTLSSKSAVVTKVHGPVIIVKERMIDGRWQLA